MEKNPIIYDRTFDDLQADVRSMGWQGRWTASGRCRTFRHRNGVALMFYVKTKLVSFRGDQHTREAMRDELERHISGGPGILDELQHLHSDHNKARSLK